MSSKLTREDLATAVDLAGVSKSRTAVDIILKTLAEALALGREIELRGFGSFDVKIAKARPGRNPNKPEHVVMIPARKIIRFRPGKLIRQSIRQLPVA